MEDDPSTIGDPSFPSPAASLEARVARLEALIEQVLRALDQREVRSRRHPFVAIHELRRRANEIDVEYNRLVEGMRRPR